MFAMLLILGACAPDYGTTAQEMRVPGDDSPPDPLPDASTPTPPSPPPPLSVTTQDACVTPRTLPTCTSSPCPIGTSPPFHVSGRCSPVGATIRIFDDHTGREFGATTCDAANTYALAVDVGDKVHAWSGTAWRKRLTLSNAATSVKLQPPLCSFATPEIDNRGSQPWHPPGQCQATANGFVYLFTGRCTVGSTIIVKDNTFGQISTNTFGRDQCMVAQVQDATGGIYPASTEGSFYVSIPYNTSPLRPSGATFGGVILARDVTNPKTAQDSAPSSWFNVNCPQ